MLKKVQTLPHHSLCQSLTMKGGSTNKKGSFRHDSININSTYSMWFHSIFSSGHSCHTCSSSTPKQRVTPHSLKTAALIASSLSSGEISKNVRALFTPGDCLILLFMIFQNPLYSIWWTVVMFWHWLRHSNVLKAVSFRPLLQMGSTNPHVWRTQVADLLQPSISQDLLCCANDWFIYFIYLFIFWVSIDEAAAVRWYVLKCRF